MQSSQEVAPLTSAPPTSAAANTAVRCWRNKPGRSAPGANVLDTESFPCRERKAQRSAEDLSPPSPNDPSIRIMIFLLPGPRSRKRIISRIAYPFTQTMHHTSHGQSGCRGGTRTHILSINNRALDQFSYPTKLGWPGENRTRCLTIKNRLLILMSFRPMVAMAGLEPAMTRLKDG